MTRSVSLAIIAAISLLNGCKAKDDRIIQRDLGVLCVGAERSDASAGELRADQAVPIIVRTSGCLDATTRDRSAKCSVKRDGDKLVVTSEMAWHADEDIGKTRGECKYLEASCATPGLPAGTYTVQLGETKTQIDVPSKLTGPCMDGTPKKPVVVATASAPPPVPTEVATNAAPPPTSTIAPPPPGDGFCVAPFASKIKNRGSVAVTLTRPNPCSGASCTTAKASCTIKKTKDNRLVVASKMPVAATAKPRKPCTDDCPGLLASCRIDNLPPGNYVVESGETKQPVQVPMMKEICLP